jgi:hypothetical protein
MGLPGAGKTTLANVLAPLPCQAIPGAADPSCRTSDPSTRP